MSISQSYFVSLNHLCHTFNFKFLLQSKITKFKVQLYLTANSKKNFLSGNLTLCTLKRVFIMSFLFSLLLSYLFLFPKELLIHRRVESKKAEMENK